MEKCKHCVEYGPECYCRRTKNLKQCLCYGDRTKCDFYTDVRAKALGTFEAQQEAVVIKLQRLNVLDENGAVVEEYRNILTRKW